MFYLGSLFTLNANQVTFPDQTVLAEAETLTSLPGSDIDNTHQNRSTTSSAPSGRMFENASNVSITGGEFYTASGNISIGEAFPFSSNSWCQFNNSHRCQSWPRQELPFNKQHNTPVAVPTHIQPSTVASVCDRWRADSPSDTGF